MPVCCALIDGRRLGVMIMVSCESRDYFYSTFGYRLRLTFSLCLNIVPDEYVIGTRGFPLPQILLPGRCWSGRFALTRSLLLSVVIDMKQIIRSAKQRH
jgi:hypothetical protein